MAIIAMNRPKWKEPNGWQDGLFWRWPAGGAGGDVIRRLGARGCIGNRHQTKLRVIGRAYVRRPVPFGIPRGSAGVIDRMRLTYEGLTVAALNDLLHQKHCKMVQAFSNLQAARSWRRIQTYSLPQSPPHHFRIVVRVNLKEQCPIFSAGL